MRAARAAKLVAKEFGRRLSDPARIAEECEGACRTSAAQLGRPWHGYSLAQGFPGIACAFGELARLDPDGDWDRIAHHHLTEGVRSAERGKLDPGLFGGLSGVLAAAYCLSLGGKRYRKLVEVLEGRLAAVLSDRPSSRFRHGMPTAEFDVISGSSGVIACILLGRSSKIGPLADLLAAELVAVAETENGIPHWYTPAQFQHGSVNPADRADTLNSGMAHGVPGPVAALALAQIEGLSVSGAADAVRVMIDWLLSHRADDAFGVNWPATIRVGDEAPAATRAAWCYGSPGIACALWLAGSAFEVREWKDMAVSAMEAVYRRPIAERRIGSPTFCHGVSGLLQITTAFLRETGDTIFAREQEKLVEEVAAAFDDATPFGVQSIDGPGQRMDRPGFLDGAAGAMAALASACSKHRSGWERLFLIS